MGAPSNRNGKRGAPAEQHGGVHGTEPPRDLPHRTERGIVATDVDGRKPFPGQHETDDLAGHRLDLRARPGTVDGGHARHGHASAAGPLELYGLPVGETLGTVPQAPPAARGGEGERHVGEQGAAGVVEVVGVFVVREQDHVDVAEVGGGAGGGRGLGQAGAARHREVVAGSVEGGVGEEPQPAVLEESGRAAEDAYGELVAGRAGSSRGSSHAETHLTDGD